MDADKAPYDVRGVSPDELGPGALPAATSALSARLGSVNIDDNLDDPFQPDLLYRGFEASPVLGTPEGLAVYQNGVRVNEAFGDTLNWDLIPGDAIARIDVVGANPVYGLNALGGAVVIGMKNGFDDPGRQLDVSGGAFGRRSIGVTAGAHSEHFAAFVAARSFDQDGWRILSSDRVRQVYVDLAARGDRLSLDLSYSGANNQLHGEGATPVQELAVDPRLIFTSPQTNAESLSFVVLNGSYSASSLLSVQANLYARDVRQAVANGNTTGAVACAGPALAAYLCQPDARTPLLSGAGTMIPDLSSGGTLPIGENDRADLHTLSLGGALQTSSTARVLGRGNQLTVGVSLDRSRVRYASSAELGVIDSELVVQPSGFVVSTPEGTDFTATPVGLRADLSDFGAFVTDTWDASSKLSITGSGRYNRIQVALHDERGSLLSGTNVYSRINPALGATYKVAAGVTAYAGYAEGSRAPTPSEIECSDPQAPCLLPSSLSADPPNLKQVVSRTFELGLRGGRPIGRGRIEARLGLYRTEVRDDIFGVATSLSAGYFQNIGGTRREGVDLDVDYRDDRLRAYASFSHVDAVFDADLTIPSPSNPFQDVNGDIHVRPGDRLPGIPRDRLKIGADYDLHRGVRIGGDVQVIGGQIYRGDEANQLAPVPGYAVVEIHASYDMTRSLQIYARIENALNARYATYGVLGDPTGVGAPGVPVAGVTNGAGVNNRFQSPAAPTAVYGGLKLKF